MATNSLAYSAAKKTSKKTIYSWALYDWANSAFALTVMCAFFPEFFKKVWASGLDVTTSTAFLGYGNSLTGFCIAVMAPFAGAIAGAGRSKKKMLAGFAIMGILSTATLGAIVQGAWVFALVIYVIAGIGFAGANIFYDSLLVDVAHETEYDKVSAMGFGLGYLGCGLLFALNIFMVQNPLFFGLSNSGEAVRAGFFMVGAWWLIFSLPIMLFVHEKKNDVSIVPLKRNIIGSLIRVRETAKEIIKSKNTLFFLLAYWFYIDGLNAFITMAYDFGLSIGLKSSALMISLLIVQFVAFPSSILFGSMSRRIGAKRSILIGVAIYIGICFFGALFLKNEIHYMFLAGFTGLAQGGIQALSRSCFARLVPPGKSADYFGFYNLVGRFGVILGPALVGTVALLVRHNGFGTTIAARVGMSSVSLLFIAGAIFLLQTRNLDSSRITSEA